MTDRPIIFDASAVRSLLAGRKTQARRLAGSPLGKCRPGDRLWVKERFVGGRMAAGGGREVAAKMRGADYVVLADGWRRYLDGSGQPGAIPTNRDLNWYPAIHMPRWASRATLVVESVRREPLQAISRKDVLAEGRLASFAGLYWNWRGPIRGVWRDPRLAFAAMWDAIHDRPGERWEDDPEVVVLEFRLEGS